MKYGLIGEKLGHSFSPDIHACLDSKDYILKEIPRDKLGDFLTRREFSAINVTIPYKQAVIPFLHYIDAKAKEIGAVNTVINKDGLLYGYNTDFFGLKKLVSSVAGDIGGKKVLILGSGGTSQTAFSVAVALGAGEVYRVGRSGKDGSVTYESAYALHTDAQVIINTTPVGMYPNPDGCPIDINKFSDLCGVIDAVFNPLCTDLVLKAKEKNIPAAGGLYMLVHQAVEASRLFTSTVYPESTGDDIYKQLLKSKQNIVLTGMPSSGKSTVGALIAKNLSRPFYDVDKEIVAQTGMSVSDIFEKCGEKGFRDIEAQVTLRLSSLSGVVISCGGGTVLRKENVNALKRNGVIFFIDRPLSQLVPTADRPLALNADAVKQRYNERIDIYISTCHKRISVEGDALWVAQQIEKEFYK